MIRRDIEKLIRHLAPKIISIFVSNGLVKRGAKRIDDLELTPKGKSIAGSSSLLVTEEWLNEWRGMWPEGYRSTNSAIRPKIDRFYQEHDTTLTEIKEATKLWLEEKMTPYHGEAKYFFYKIDKNVEVSRCEEYIEIIKERKNKGLDNTVKLVGDEED